MAASVIACDNYVIITNGNRFISVPTRTSGGSPQKIQDVTIPDGKDTDDSLTKNGDKKQTQDSNSGVNRILARGISPDGSYLAICDDRKLLHLYTWNTNTDVWDKLSSRSAARRCTAIRFTKDSSHVLVADKSGDVYCFPVTGPLSEDTGELKLGHLSMLLDMMLIEGDDYVVTCDRDEKVRISNYPESFNIKAFCLGHSSFVISLAYDSKQKVILSGSGDCTVRLWTLEGKQLLSHNVSNDLPEEEISTVETHTSDIQEEPRDNKTDTKEQQAVKEIVYCEPCKLLCVGMYKSSKVLVYQVTSSLLSGVALTLFSTLTGNGHVISMSLHKCMLWLLRRDNGSLNLAAHVLDNKTITQINSEDNSTEATVIRKVMAEKSFLQGSDDLSDMFLHLRKSNTDVYVEEYKERKRQRIEGNNSECRFGKQKKKVEEIN